MPAQQGANLASALPIVAAADSRQRQNAISLTSHQGMPQLQHALHVHLGGRLELRQLAGPLVGPVYPAAGLQVLLFKPGMIHRDLQSLYLLPPRALAHR